jgi:hypothetical protein
MSLPSEWVVGGKIRFLENYLNIFVSNNGTEK